MASQMRLARLLESELMASGDFSLTSPGTLPILNLKLRVPQELCSDAHRAFVAEVTEDGQYWISTTRVHGESVIRLMVISYLTEEKNVLELAARMQAAAKKVMRRASLRA
jgi:glutamate/tyrosine decarboxylase-like PLP-dependent enzyme